MSTLDRREADTAVPVTPARTDTDTTTCRCGHAKGAHEHFRAGSDCGACDCAKYRRQR